MKNSTLSKILAYIFSVFSVFALWILFAKITASSVVLPSPSEVFVHFIKIVKKSFFWKSFGFTFLRVIISFLISVLFGTLLGTACGYSSFFYNFLQIPLSVIRSTPVAALILIVIFWFDSSFVPVFISVLMTLPIIITGVYSGLNDVNEKDLQMAKIYKFSDLQIFLYIKSSSLIRYLLSSCVQSFGVTWKVIAASEVLCLPKYASGTILHNSQVSLETADVMAVTFFLTAVSFILEKAASFFVKSLFKKGN